MVRALLSLLLTLTVVLNAQAWGQKGHDIIAYIAECHLSEKSRIEVDRALNGTSMLYWSNWADSAKYSKEYSYTAPWHYRNVEMGETPSSTPTPKEGDVVWAVEEMISRLRDDSLSQEEHTLALKFLIHLMGDLHCPMHAGRSEDQGGGTIPMVFFYEATNLHVIWDSGLIERVHDWSYTEWAEQLDRVSEEEYQRIVSGTPSDWFSDSYAIAVEVYQDAKRYQEVSYDYRDKYQLPLEKQLRNGGLRLAEVLNNIYK